MTSAALSGPRTGAGARRGPVSDSGKGAEVLWRALARSDQYGTAFPNKENASHNTASPIGTTTGGVNHDMKPPSAVREHCSAFQALVQISRPVKLASGKLAVPPRARLPAQP